MNAFLTGSQVYGTPRPDSDTDLVILTDGGNLERLLGIVGKADPEGLGASQPYYEDGLSLRFGNLNLLCVTEKKHFDVWKRGTEELEKQKPVTRDFAIEFLARLRRVNRIEGW